MTWQFKQSNGVLTHGDDFTGVGYSGTGDGRDNPDMQEVHNVGPIPCGEYTIGDAHADGKLGPCVMNLDPKPGTETFGRSLFRIHGNNVSNDASHGCIVMGPSIRQAVSASEDRDLVVIP